MILMFIGFYSVLSCDILMQLLSRCSRQREWLHAMGLSICLSVCLFVSVFVCHQNAETRFSRKLCSLELWSPLTTIGSRTWAFQRTHYWTPKIQDGGDPPSWILL